MAGRLDQQHVVVIGGTSGMGLATAQAAAAAGARVTIAGRDPSRLQRALQSLGAQGQGRTLDILDPAQLTAFFGSIEVFDHLVMTAHASSVVTGAIAPLADMTLEAARAFMETKFWGPFTAAKYGAPKVKADGSVIFFSGAAGARKLLPHHTAIGATNGAVEAFARQLAKEIAPKRVNVIAAGLVQTPTYDGMSDEARAGMYAGYAKQALVGRVGLPEDIAAAAIYLKDGLPYEAGDKLVLKDLAKSYRLIAEKGPDVFYKGEIAEAIEKAVVKDKDYFDLITEKSHRSA
jgi:NAD(P)-dependent dehydrogenase (short-subunit alcohol dehydrogenase family)